MENASKALLMAAEVLIGVLILSFFAYVFLNIGQYIKEKEDANNVAKVFSYNAQIETYVGTDLTIYEVLELYTKVINNNNQEVVDSYTNSCFGTTLTIVMPDDMTLSEDTTQMLGEFIQAPGSKKYSFKELTNSDIQKLVAKYSEVVSEQITDTNYDKIGKLKYVGRINEEKTQYSKTGVMEGKISHFEIEIVEKEY